VVTSTVIDQLFLYSQANRVYILAGAADTQRLKIAKQLAEVIDYAFRSTML